MNNDVYSWYQTLEKPFFAPPQWIFGPAWTILYVLIVISFIYLFTLYRQKKVERELMTIFILNMIGNLLFSPVQFGLQSNVMATFVILYVLVTLIIFEKKIWTKSKKIFYLMLPYLLWVSFATILQISITVLNF